MAKNYFQVVFAEIKPCHSHKLNKIIFRKETQVLSLKEQVNKKLIFTLRTILRLIKKKPDFIVEKRWSIFFQSYLTVVIECMHRSGSVTLNIILCINCFSAIKCVHVL